MSKDNQTEFGFNQKPETLPVDSIFPGADRVNQISKGFCAKSPFGCGKPITGFKDKLSEKEYEMSGLCQTCQDNIFG